MNRHAPACSLAVALRRLNNDLLAPDGMNPAVFSGDPGDITAAMHALNAAAGSLAEAAQDEALHPGDDCAREMMIADALAILDTVRPYLARRAPRSIPVLRATTFPASAMSSIDNPNAPAEPRLPMEADDSHPF